MREILIGANDIQNQRFEYYLLAETLGTEEGCETYGVKIAGSGGDGDAVRDITVSQGRILCLLSALVKFQVTPVSLRDVVEDWLLAD